MLNSDCKVRFENLIPPGFEDRSKEKKETSQFGYAGNLYNEAYGDFYIWYELLEKVKALESTTVFFVTNDAKRDTVHRVGLYIKTGAHASLREELFEKTPVKNFEILSTYEFITEINNIYRLDIDQNDIRVNLFNFWRDNIIQNNLSQKTYMNDYLEVDENDELLQKLKENVLLSLLRHTSKDDDEHNE